MNTVNILIGIAVVAGLGFFYQRWQRRKAEAAVLNAGAEVESAKLDGKIKANQDKIDDNKTKEAEADRVKANDGNATDYWKNRMKK